MAWINKKGLVEYHSKEESEIKDSFLVFGDQTNIALTIPSNLRGKEFRLRIEVNEV